jgi:hypothetical protein
MKNREILVTTILPALVWLVLSAKTEALVQPPDGGYPGANTAEGTGALNSLTPQARGSGANNTALGYHTLFTDTTGFGNTATGSQALFSNVEGYFNTATGYLALYHNVGSAFLAFGLNNTATGSKALFSNTTGNANVAIGFQALYGNTDGLNNVAVGDNALCFNTTGSENIAVNPQAGISTTGDDNIIIGHSGEAEEDHTIHVGTQEQHTATYIAGISGTMVSGTAVVVNGPGQLGVAPSPRTVLNDQ